MDPAFALSYGALWVVVVVQTVILLGVLGAIHTLQVQSGSARPIPELPPIDISLVGSRAPGIQSRDVFDRPINTAIGEGRPLALVFVSPDCKGCTTTLEELEALSWKARGNTIVICRDTSEHCRPLAEVFGDGIPVIADPELATSDQYRVRSVPTAVLIGADGLIQKYGFPGRSDEIRALLLGTVAEEV